MPDSAGTATALFTGVKTGMGMVGMDHRARRGVCERREGSELSSLADWATGQGRKVGVVTTTKITHATPAAVYAHSNDRSALSVYLVSWFLTMFAHGKRDKGNFCITHSQPMQQ